MNAGVAEIKPPKGRQFRVKQSRFKVLDGTNPCRPIVLGSSGAGADVWLTSFFTDIMRGCYERIFWFSPSCDVDHQMVHLKAYVKDVLNVPFTEKWCFSEWNPEDLWKIMEDQKIVVEELKKKEGTTLLPGIAVVINDWADRADITHANNNPITSSFIRARHWAQSTYVVSQKLALVSPSIRVNCTHMCVLRSASTQCIKLFCEEYGALAGGAENLMKIYEYAINDRPFSFLWCNFKSTDTKKIFMLRFERYLYVEDVL
jgi:hypothetical protein